MSFSQKILEPSELILTDGGRIYHLDLAPEMLADTVITVGDPARVPQISKYFDHTDYEGHHREFVTHTGYIGKKRISVTSTGIGPDNIDIVINELDALVNIDFATRTVKDTKKSLSIFRMGTSGALQEDVPVDGIVVSSFGIGLDNLLHYYQYENNAEEQYIINEFMQHTGLTGKPLLPYIAEGSIKLRKHFGPEFHHGITVTCPGFYAPQGRMLRAPLALPALNDALTSFTSRQHRITNFEMETSAIYGLGKILGHHCLSINMVINNRIQKRFSKDYKAGVDNMIQKSLEIIEQIPEV